MYSHRGIRGIRNALFYDDDDDGDDDVRLTMVWPLSVEIFFLPLPSI